MNKPEAQNHYAPVDQAQRIQAIDPRHSFVVQAPAGSGKTQLLVSRFLKLLASVEAPEEIIATTFTRKAADEMSERVIEILQLAQLKRAGDELACKDMSPDMLVLAELALDQNEALKWGILENPSRLRIQTLDSFCLWLVSQLPLYSGLGGLPNIETDAREYYKKAVQNAIKDGLKDSKLIDVQLKDAVQLLLKSSHYNMDMLQSTLMDMLALRDQWLRVIARYPDLQSARTAMEESWVDLIVVQLKAIRKKCWLTVQDIECLVFAGKNIGATHPDNPLAILSQLKVTLDDSIESLPYWRAIAQLVLTNADTVRSQVNKNMGFPSDKPSSDYKNNFKALLSRIAQDDQLVELLISMKTLPEPHYNDQEWQQIEALYTLLKHIAAHLKLVFREYGVADYSEITARALHAISDEELGVNLAQKLDYKIQHLLIDEFQDTSMTQLLLVQQLTKHWSDADEHTLFIVGDPMQSIYRFREANVGGFVQVFEQGMGDLKIRSIKLEENFRSTKALVDGFNDLFSNIFPRENNIDSGAIEYAKATAKPDENTLDKQDSISLHLSADQDEEAAQVLEIIEQSASKDIAILFRSRNHLKAIYAALLKKGQEFTGVDIDPLAQSQVVLDMSALARVLCYEADDVAWLALLRAPFCGLSLSALHQLLKRPNHKTIWQCLDYYSSHQQAFDALSGDERTALDAFIAALRPFIEHDINAYDPYLNALHKRVEACWRALGAHAFLSNDDQGNIDRYMNALAHKEQAGEIVGREDLIDLIDGLWAISSEKGEKTLQMMTIHKSKGLQFDCVILPGLSRKNNNPSKKLLTWFELNRNIASDSQLLVSGFKDQGIENSVARYGFISNVEKKAEHNEKIRLLYVACTRAKSQLHLMMHKTKPTTNTLAEILYHGLSGEQQQCFDDKNPPQDDADDEQKMERTFKAYHRPNAKWHQQIKQLSLQNKNISWQSKQLLSENKIDYSWAGRGARIAGTLVHDMLLHLAENQLEFSAFKMDPSYQLNLKQRLLSAGLSDDEVNIGLKRINDVMVNIRDDKRAAWIFSSEHREVHNEWALTCYDEGDLKNMFVDRSFIDKDQIRWVVDYKTSTHEGGNLAGFLSEEKKRYAKIMQQYADTIRHVDGDKNQVSKIKLGLYFPLMSQWVEWDYEP